MPESEQVNQITVPHIYKLIEVYNIRVRVLVHP